MNAQGAAGCLEAWSQGEPGIIPPWFRLPQGVLTRRQGEALPGDQRRSACCRSVTPLAACHRASSAPPPRSSTIQTLLPSGNRRSLRRVVSFSFPRCNRDSAGPPWPGSSVACPAGAVPSTNPRLISRADRRITSPCLVRPQYFGAATMACSGLLQRWRFSISFLDPFSRESFRLLYWRH